MPLGRPRKTLTLTADERDKLLTWSRRPTSDQRLALRSNIVLAAAEGHSNTQIAADPRINPIERVWGVLEKHWNGTLLSSASEALRWASTMTWGGLGPIVSECRTIYERGVRVAKNAFGAIAERLQRSATLPKWSLTIKPQ